MFAEASGVDDPVCESRKADKSHSVGLLVLLDFCPFPLFLSAQITIGALA